MCSRSKLVLLGGRVDTRVLTGLRFLAAAIVVVYHFGKDISLVSILGRGFLTAGPQMVGFFFVLSGFIMAYVYLGRPDFRIGEYIVARFSRIIPVYMLALFALIYFKSFEGWQIFVDFTLLKAWFPQFAIGGNFPGWSISVEVFFYLLFPFVLFLIKKVGFSVFGFTGSILLFWIFSQFLLVDLYYSDFYKLGGKVSHGLIFYNPLSHVSSFLVGIATAYVLLNYRSNFDGRAVGLCFVGGVVSACLIYWILNERVSNFFGFKILNAAGGLAPIYAFFIFSIVVSSRGFRWILANNISVLLGEASYSFYILQVPVFLAFNEIFVARYSLSGDSLFWLYFLFLLVVSLMVFIFMERPVRDLLNGAYRRLVLGREQHCVA